MLACHRRLLRAKRGGGRLQLLLLSFTSSRRHFEMAPLPLFMWPSSAGKKIEARPSMCPLICNHFVLLSTSNIIDRLRFATTV